MPTSTTMLPVQNTKTDTALDYIIISTKLLQDISDATSVPYLKAIAGISVMIVETIQTVRRNKQDCIKMTERAYDLICAIINIFGESEEELSPSTIRNIVQFTSTLQKLLSYVRIQADGSLFSRLRRHAEISRLLADCKEGLSTAMDDFGIASTISNAATLAQIRAEEHRRHQEIMTFLESKMEKFKLNTNSGWSTSTLHSLLPPEPQIFYGRSSELKQVLTALQSPEDARVAILGQGGIGKTSLAVSALHHPDIIEKFAQRYFIACDSAGSFDELGNAMASSLGINDARKPARAIVEYFQEKAEKNNVLLVLDNFETPWEGQSRKKTEDFLTSICNVKNLSVIVTLRGIERPSGPRWTRPFLPPLQTLPFDAAKSLFVEISDQSEDDPHIPEIIKLTDSLPLAVKLLAQLASFEGCEAVLRRWNEEKDYLYTDGDDKTSNLDISIGLSLSSYRFRTQKGARELLSAISLLPIGISDVVLKQVGMPIDAVLKCKSILCSTALAYIDNSGRLRTLAPVREYMLKVHPPTPEIYSPLCQHFYEFIDILCTSRESPPKGLIQQVNSNLANSVSLLRFATLVSAGDIRKKTIQCAIQLAIIDHFTGFDMTAILSSIEKDIEELESDEWGGWYYYILAQCSGQTGASHRGNLERAGRIFESINHHHGIVKSYHALAISDTTFHLDNTVALPVDKMACMKKCIQAAEESQDPRLQASAYYSLSVVYDTSGSVVEALKAAIQAKEFARISGSLRVENQCLVKEASLYLALGNLPSSLKVIKQATNIFAALGVDKFSATTLNKDMLLGAVYYFKSEYDEALKVFESRVSTIEGSGDLSTKMGLGLKAQFMSNAIEINYLTGRASMDEIKRQMSAVERVHAVLGSSTLIETDHAIDKAYIQFLSGAFAEARRICRNDVLDIICNGGWATQRCLELLCDIYLAEHDYQSALNHAVIFLLYALNNSQVYIQSALRHIGDAFVGFGDDETALSLFQTSFSAYERMDVHRGKADCMLRIGDIAYKRGELDRAHELWRNAIPLFERSEQHKDVVSCKKRLLTSNVDTIN